MIASVGDALRGGAYRKCGWRIETADGNQTRHSAVDRAHRVRCILAVGRDVKMERAGQNVWIIGRQTQARTALCSALERCGLSVWHGEIGVSARDRSVVDLIVVFLTGEQCEAVGRMLTDPHLRHTKRVFVVDSSDRRARLYCATARLDDIILEPIGVREALVRILLVLTRSNHAQNVTQAVISFDQSRLPPENRLLCNMYSSGVMPAVVPTANTRGDVETHLRHAHEPLVTAMTKIKRDTAYSDLSMLREEADDWVRDEAMLPITIVEEPEASLEIPGAIEDKSAEGDSRSASPSSTPCDDFSEGGLSDGANVVRSNASSGKTRAKRDHAREHAQKPVCKYPTPEEWRARRFARLDAERSLKERRQNAILIVAIAVCLSILAVVLYLKSNG